MTKKPSGSLNNDPVFEKYTPRPERGGFTLENWEKLQNTGMDWAIGCHHRNISRAESVGVGFYNNYHRNRLALETFNSALETLCNVVSPAIDPKIKAVKDLAAAGVLLFCFIALIIGVIIFLPRLYLYLIA